MEIWCRHFTGIQNDTCEAGIKYVDVRIVPPKGMYQWPCINSEHRAVCPHFAPYTQEEIDQREREVTEAVERLNAFGRRETENCPHCGQHVARLQQIGRCVYAQPCGCRIWQGQVPEAWE